mgnify:CR=1 FL=1
MCKIFKRKQILERNRIDIDFDKNHKIDMNNVVQSIFLAESLYDSLKTKCHPDKFVFDNQLMIKADNIFKEISENKRNYSRLKELAEIAKKELGIIL